tara:strand:- start:91 stop:651 length:561 start_codon:yes stop_codon:yes gene_type:complete
MCPHISRSLEAFRRIYAGHVGQGDNDANARNRHQSPTDEVTPGKLNAMPVESLECFDYGTPGADPNRGPTGKGVAKYRGLKLTCQACPSKSRCCPNMDFRSITREEHEDARQAARDIAKTRQYDISMKLRKKVEMLFAHLKRILGLGRLRLRGPCGANDEFLLAATAQNLRKLAKIFPAPQQTRKA